LNYPFTKAKASLKTTQKPSNTTLKPLIKEIQMLKSNSEIMYALGKGVPQDYSKAIQYYTQAANKGNTNAQVNLGIMYAFGKGVPQNFLKAIQYYTQAANNGNTDAQYYLGMMYRDGKIVPQDYSKAKFLFEQSCLNKNQMACDNYRKLNN